MSLHILVKLFSICHESLLMVVRILMEGQGQGFTINTLLYVCGGGDKVQFLFNILDREIMGITYAE